MIWIGILQIALFVVVLLALTKPMGMYIARVFKREKTLLDPLLRPVENAIYRVCGVDPDREVKWTTYTSSMLIFSMAGVIVLYLILRLQSIHPWNAAHAPSMDPYLAFNTAVSFVTNTNWQAYAGESAATYFTQMVGLTWQNFISAGGGAGAGYCFHQSTLTPVGRGNRKLLGRPDSWLSVGIIAVVDSVRTNFDIARRDSELVSLHPCHYIGRQ